MSSGRRRQRLSGRRRSAPRPGAGCVDEHAVEAPGRPWGSGPVRHHHLAAVASQRLGDQLRTMWLALVGEQPRAALVRQRREQSRLATGAGAQVEPALVAALDGGPGQGQGDQLGTGVLHPGASVAHRRDRARVAGIERSPRAARGSVEPASSSTVDNPGRATRVTRGRSLSAASSASSSSGRPSAPGQLDHDPRAGARTARPARRRAGPSTRRGRARRSGASARW